MGVKVLIDTNILIDYLLKRQPDHHSYENARQLYMMCAKGELRGYMAAHSVMNIFYILRKDYSSDERRKMLLDLCKVITVIEIDNKKIISSLKNFDFKDFEDCLQSECAKECGAEYIITRNIGDFSVSSVKAVTPEDFFNSEFS